MAGMELGQEQGNKLLEILGVLMLKITEATRCPHTTEERMAVAERCEQMMPVRCPSPYILEGVYVDVYMYIRIYVCAGIGSDDQRGGGEV